MHPRVDHGPRSRGRLTEVLCGGCAGCAVCDDPAQRRMRELGLPDQGRRPLQGGILRTCRAAQRWQTLGTSYLVGPLDDLRAYAEGSLGLTDDVDDGRAIPGSLEQPASARRPTDSISAVTARQKARAPAPLRRNPDLSCVTAWIRLRPVRTCGAWPQQLPRRPRGQAGRRRPRGP